MFQISTRVSNVMARHTRRSLYRVLLLAVLGLLMSLGLGWLPSLAQPASCPVATAAVKPSDLKLLQSTSHAQLLKESWLAYRQRFIQDDGRVIDRESHDRTTSEGQAYAMLRSVLINDHDTFARTLTWADTNLVRHDPQQPDRTLDHLWAWHWGNAGQNWQILDSNFASDADVDTATALILAARRWQCPTYLAAARTKLADLWEYATVAVGDRRYLLPGPRAAFWNQPDRMILNPSYLAPYTFRLFAQVDPDHDWMRLVDSSYHILQASATLSKVGLPSDWVALNPQTDTFAPLALNTLQSQYGYDAYRVWWRLALDATWFREPRAKAYLSQHTAYLTQLWQKQHAIPAQIDRQGQAIVPYEATSQYAMLYAALQVTQPRIAQQIYQRKLMAQYRNGFWDNNSAYYSQNLTWFALLPAAPPTQVLSQRVDRAASSFVHKVSYP